MARPARNISEEGAASGPGLTLRGLRKTNGWTLADVAGRTGVPVSTLSRIENGHVSPTYDILMRLSRGLELDMAELFSGKAATPPLRSAQPGRRSINRAGEGEQIALLNHTLRYQSTDLLGKLITPIISEYSAQTLGEFGDFMRHPGEEYLYVLEGELELHTECYAPVLLKAGDSIYFDSRMGHAYIAKTKPCRALSICAAEGADSDPHAPADRPAGAAQVTPLRPKP